MQRRRFLQSGTSWAIAATLPRQLYADTATDLLATRSDGSPATIEQKAIDDLKAHLRGRLLLKQDPGYDLARQVLNPAIDRYPALIVQPTGAVDVGVAVRFARERNLLLAVKCGGHSFSGQSTCNGGLQIDLAALRGVRVDPRARRAWVAGGTLLGAVDHEVVPHGLVTPLGTVSHTGAGGLTTGGGFGRMARRFGLALDNVTAVDIVSADGKLRRASPKDNPDLYWAVRGGGGNFGVVTHFEFRLHPADRTVVGGTHYYSIDKARDLLRLYADFAARAPDDLYLDAWISYPSPRKPVCGIDICYSGLAGNADRALAPLSKLGAPLKSTLKSLDYIELQRSTDQSDARNEGGYTKSGFVSTITDANIRAVVDGLNEQQGFSTTVYFQHSGGAIGRVRANATAFPHRHALASMMVFADWPVAADSERPIRWAREYWKTLEPFTRGFYVNEIEGTEGASAFNANYLGNYPRLAAIKQSYDPTNLFRLNANITPQSSAPHS